jgi:hypothetical protein
MLAARFNVGRQRQEYSSQAYRRTSVPRYYAEERERVETEGYLTLIYTY